MVKRFDKLCFYEIFNVIISLLQLELLYQVSSKYKSKNYQEIWWMAIDHKLMSFVNI